MDYTRILYSEISFKPAVQTATITTTINNNGNTTTTKNNNNTNTNTNNHIIISSNNNQNNNHNHNNVVEEFQPPKHQLCDPNLVKLDWLQSEKIGGGLINVGNTCFLNSVLQCLTYCPPLYNFLIKLNGGHSSSCKINQFCMLCEMEKHVKRIKNSSGSAIKPISIVQRLKYINKSFQFGRQEDAHEFLRYILDHMWKACLLNLDINCKSNKLDPRIKETTVINHIFGGYHQSQVLCLSCNSRSNTFDFFMDFILDISNAKSLEDALRKFTQPETLEHENAYKCSKCRKKVMARKKFTVYKAPNVATFQLKRFDSDRIFGGKITKHISYPDELNLRPYMSDTTKSPIKYQLGAVLVHVGPSSNSGHYFCFIKNSNNFWYRMDDSNVSLVTQSTVLQQQAYVLFYTRKTTIDQRYPSNGIKQQESINNLSKEITTNNNTTIATSNNTSNNLKNCNNNNTHNIINNRNHNNDTSISNNINNHNNTSTTSTSSLIQSSPNTNQSDSQKQTNGNHKITNYFAPVGSSFTTWQGSKSKLDEEESNKRKLTENTKRDEFNEELDQGKIKKIKSRPCDHRFELLFKVNPFQRPTSNNYQQYKNNNNKKRDNNGFQKHNGRQYNNDKNNNGFSQHCHLKSNFRRHHDSHKNRFRHGGKHKGRNRRQ